MQLKEEKAPNFLSSSPPGGAGQAEARGDPVHNAAQGGKGSNCSGGEEDKKFGSDQIKLNNVPVASECSSFGIGETSQFHFQRTGGQTEGSWDLQVRRRGAVQQ